MSGSSPRSPSSPLAFALPRSRAIPTPHHNDHRHDDAALGAPRVGSAPPISAVPLLCLVRDTDVGTPQPLVRKPRRRSRSLTQPGSRKALVHRPRTPPAPLSLPPPLAPMDDSSPVPTPPSSPLVDRSHRRRARTPPAVPSAAGAGAKPGRGTQQGSSRPVMLTDDGDEAPSPPPLRDRRRSTSAVVVALILALALCCLLATVYWRHAANPSFTAAVENPEQVGREERLRKLWTHTTAQWSQSMTKLRRQQQAHDEL